MGELRCVDGSMLSVEPVTCHDRAGRPYEITLKLSRNGVPFAAVGQRCGYELSRLAERVSAARLDPAQACLWPNPDDRFPVPSIDEPGDSARPEATGAGSAGQSASACLPGDCEYFALRSRDRGDPPGSGELRCVLRSSADWLGECAGVGGRHRTSQRAAVRVSAAGHGGWRLTRRAVIEAWGASGVGVRAILTSAELMAFLKTVLTGLAGDPPAEIPRAREGQGAPAGDLPAGLGSASPATPPWRQRGRVPDGIARSRVPALRAQARGGPLAPGDAAARRGDVRR